MLFLQENVRIVYYRIQESSELKPRLSETAGLCCEDCEKVAFALAVRFDQDYAEWINFIDRSITFGVAADCRSQLGIHSKLPELPA